MELLGGGQALAIILLSGCLMAHLVWDWRELILPDLIIALFWLIGMVVALTAPLPGCSWHQAWQGSLLALATAWGFYELVWRLRGEEGFGFGDVARIAKAAKGEDRFGFKDEFIDLVSRAEGLERLPNQSQD
jgi:prepilin signal peptidase PulO-like enzyme (type II secretory pathway)